MSIYFTKAQREYAGPQSLKLHADLLPYIGELVISFSWLERRITWALESMLGASIEEADLMEKEVMNFSARISFFEVAGRNIARRINTEEDFNKIVESVRTANTFRNIVMHNRLVGLSMAPNTNGEFDVSAIKDKYAKRIENRSYKISVDALRAGTEANIDICSDIQRWIICAFPNASNRVP